MNYLIWNGKDSRDIKGLVICELPPISKPKMRVAETVIDGVDGSLIEELGYESYDKALTLGTTQKADINEVIKFFSGSGEVVFSNEPDKYYKATIINQIDYARLVRFRTATVVFRVQPFKYEHQEEPTISGEKETTGATIELQNANVVGIHIDGKSTQDGTPTPETPAEIKSIGESKTINIAHKSNNIFDIQAPYISDCVSVSIAENKISVTSDETGLARVQFPLDYKLNTPHILSFDATMLDGLDVGLVPNVRIRKDRETLAVIELIATTDKKHYELIIPPMEEEGYELWLYLKTEATVKGIMSVDFENIQIEEGTTATDYVPYRNGTCNISLPEPLRSLPNGIKDSIDIKNNRASIVSKTGSVILDGSADELWSTYAIYNNDGGNGHCYVIEDSDFALGLNSSICTRFKNVGGSAYSPLVGYVGAYSDHLTVHRKYFISDIETLEGFKSWLSQNNIEIIYQKEYPTITEIEDRTGAYTMPEGSMTITNSENADMVVTYVDKEIEIINKGNHTARPVIAIRGTGYIEFILNGNKVFSYMFPNDEDTVVIDCEKQDAYLGADLKNRNMSGEFPVFEIGENIITWEGNIESIEISSKSRWL